MLITTTVKIFLIVNSRCVFASVIHGQITSQRISKFIKDLLKNELLGGHSGPKQPKYAKKIQWTTVGEGKFGKILLIFRSKFWDLKVYKCVCQNMPRSHYP